MCSRRKEKEHGRRGRDEFERRRIARVARHGRQEERRRGEDVGLQQGGGGAGQEKEA